MLNSMGQDGTLQAVFDTEDDTVALRSRAWSVIDSLNEVRSLYQFPMQVDALCDQVQGDKQEESQGAILLIGSILLQTYDAVTDDSEGTATPILEVSNTFAYSFGNRRTR